MNQNYAHRDLKHMDFRHTDLTYASLYGADIRPDLTGQAKGSIIMVLDENGIFLGCGRVSVDRIRNFNK